MLKKLKDIVRKSSIHVCIVNCGGCNGCDVELVADVLLVTGAVTEQWRDNLRRIYAKTPEPKIVVAVGNCPQSGDVFAQEGGRVLAPVSDFIPVDAAIPGCPPRPSEILEAVLTVAPGALAAKGRAQDARKD